MKVMHIISSPAAGGAEIYVKDLCINMAKNGCDIFILFISHAVEIGRSKEFENNFLEELTANNIAFDFVGNDCKRNIYKGIKKVRKATKFFDPDIIHSHLYFGAIFSLFTNKKNRIYTHHNIKLRASKHIYKVLDLGTKAYIGICEACTELLKTHTHKRVVKINNGVDPQRVIKKLQSCDEPNKPIKIFMAGRLVEQKNYKLILEALSEISFSNYQLIIAGEGPEKEKLEILAKRLGISGKVIFLGNCNNVNEAMSEADVFAMCSAWEGLPISLIEATLAGLPVIVTGVGGCAEIVNYVNNGIIVHNLSANSYGNALNSILVSPSLREKFHKNALNKSHIYTIESCVEQHINLYYEILNS